MHISVPQPSAAWALAGRTAAFAAISCVAPVLLTAGFLGMGLEQAFYLTLGQVGHMAVHYPVWAWLLFVALLAAGTRLWGVIGAAVLFCYPVSRIVRHLDVRAIEPTGADTADIVFALGHLHRLMILSMIFLWLVVIPVILWRRRKLQLNVTQACFSFRLRAGAPGR